MVLNTEAKYRDDCLLVVHTGKIVMGEGAKYIDESQKLQIGLQVSEKLKLHPFSMLQFSQEDLVGSMGQGRAILCLDEISAQLLAFGQIWHYGQNLEGQYIYEFGSWVSFTRVGFGREVLKAAPQLHTQIYPGTQLLAIVETNNVRARVIMEKSGGILIGSKFSESIRTQAEVLVPATMIIYDITKKE